MNATETKEPDTADDFIMELSAGMAGQTKDDYVNTRTEWLGKLEELEKAANELKVKTFEDYDRGRGLKSILSSLFCFAFNNHNDIWEKVGDIEDIVGRKLGNFVVGHKTKDSKVKTVCRYLLWGRYYYRQDVEKIYNFLMEHDVLRKKGSAFLVIGLHGKVGDNVFSVDNMGRQHRTYVRTCGFQAMYIGNSELIKYMEENHLQKDIPELEERYTGTSVRDGKHSVRPIRMRYKEKRLIQEEFCRQHSFANH